MNNYRIQKVYSEDGNVVNYCIYKDDYECIYDVLSFANYLKRVANRNLSTIHNKITSLLYWYQFADAIDQPIDSFFTTQTQLDFVDILQTKTNYRRKKTIYLAGSDPYEKGLSPKTIQRHLGNINEYYNYLSGHGMIELRRNYLPFRKELKLNIDNRSNRITLPETLSPEEVRRLMDACTTRRDRAIIATMASTGLRVGEICSLTIKALDFKKRTVHLRRQYLDLENGVLKTGERELFGTAAMFNEIHKYILFERNKVAKCDTLFVTLQSRNGEPAGMPLSNDSIKKIFTRLREKTGIRNCHAHILRHTFASLFLASSTKNSKVTVAVLQKLLGHKNINTTMIYTHLDYSLDDFKENADFENSINQMLTGV